MEQMAYSLQLRPTPILVHTIGQPDDFDFGNKNSLNPFLNDRSYHTTYWGQQLDSEIDVSNKIQISCNIFGKSQVLRQWLWTAVSLRMIYDCTTCDRGLCTVHTMCHVWPFINMSPHGHLTWSFSLSVRPSMCVTRWTLTPCKPKLYPLLFLV